MATVAGTRRVLAAGDDGTPVVVAGLYDDATETTRIINNTNNQSAFRGGNNQAGDGVEGFSRTGSGVHGHSTQGVGVQGWTSTGTGVLAETASDFGVAVRGRTSGHHSQVAVEAETLSGVGEGYAVRARTKNGIAAYGEATGGFALQAVGRAVFSRSGKVTFAAGQSSRTVSGHLIEADTVVVAVAGTYVRGVSLSIANDTFTIRLNKAAPTALKAERA